MRLVDRFLVALLFALPACGGDDDSGDDDAVTIDAAAEVDAPSVPDADPGPKTEFGGDRPATLNIPPSYEPGTPTPLLLVLSGYASDPSYTIGYLRLDMAHMTEDIFTIQRRDSSTRTTTTTGTARTRAAICSTSSPTT